jgi:hypothetical protein
MVVSCTKASSEREHRAVVEQLTAELLLLISLRISLQEWIVEAFLELVDAAVNLDPAVAVERVDPERRPPRIVRVATAKSRSMMPLKAGS